MSFIRVLTIITLSVLSTSQVFADNSRMYFEFDYATNTTNTVNTFGASTSAESDMDGAVIKLGYDLNNWIAFEGHLGSTTTNDESAPTYSSKIDYMAFAGARFNLRYDHFTVYGLAGAGYTQITETSSGTLYETTKAAPAYGVGLDFYGSKTTAFTLSYIQYVDSTEIDLSSFQFGVKFYFDKPKFYKRY